MSRQNGEKIMAGEKVTKSATVKTAYGQELNPPISFEFSYLELQTYEDIPSDEMPDEKQILSSVNQNRYATARSAAQAKALGDAGIEKPTLANADVAFRTMVRAMVAQGHSQPDAESAVRALLGL